MMSPHHVVSFALGAAFGHAIVDTVAGLTLHNGLLLVAAVAGSVAHLFFDKQPANLARGD